MKKNLLLIVLLFFAFSTFAQTNYWKHVNANDVNSFTKGKTLFTGSFQPAKYKLFNLNENDLAAFLKQSPQEKNVRAEQSKFIVKIPVADGSIEEFRVTESTVMEPGLQAKHPEIKSYSGEGVADHSSIIRFDFSPYGFHATIISANKPTVYINPITTAKNLYTVFDRSNIAQEKQVFDCNVEKVLNSQIQNTPQTTISSDNNLRTYRFAVASGGEFSKLFLDGTETSDLVRKAKVLAGLVTDLNRTNIIFETDFGIHLNYVNNEDTIIFLDGKTDPFQSSTAGYSGTWNRQSQQTLDKYIGTANYDVGHLLMGFNTGGNADCIGCVCNAPNKGSGATGFTTDLTSDPFIIDFWDHEIGHQFGANHTFDFQFEGTGAQMEPGSASTIMGYAGYTGTYDIQPHSDAYFHAISIQQIYNYVSTGKGSTCAVLSIDHDHLPAANAGVDHTIPKSTPFVLTAKSSDADVNDTLTYCWEQFDNYLNNGTSNQFPNASATTGPVFRSLTPTVSNERTFPALSSILNGTNKNEWEVLPSVTRTLNFRLTVRDNHPGGGRTKSNDMAVHVVASAGPFTVTSPNTNVSWQAGSKHTIKWNVANTNLSPVNCTRVQILLSTDGGQTFNIVLKTGVVNDGAVQITLPQDISTTHARIKIISVGNIFFDISDADFRITSAAFANSVNDASAANIVSAVKVQPNPAKEYTNIIFNAASDNCSISLSNSDGRIIYTKKLNNVYKGMTEKIALAGLSSGNYFLKIVTDKKTQTEKIIVQ